MIKRRENSFSLQNLGNILFQKKINVLKNWLRDHSSWATCGIGMKIEGILKFCFWILLPQGTFSLLCSRIQDYMLSLMNEVDPCVTFAVGFVWDAKPIFPTSISMLMPCINKELINIKLFMLYNEDSTLHHLFSQNQKSSSI